MEQPDLVRIHLRSQAVHNEHPPLCNGRTGIPSAQFAFPAKLGTSFRETGDDPLFAPLRIAVCAQPLRPIFRLAKR